MLYLVIFLLACTILIAFILLQRLQVDFLYEWKDGTDSMKVHFKSLYGLLKYDYSASIFSGRKSDTKPGDKDKKKPGFADVFKRYTNIRNYYRENSRAIQRVFGYLKRWLHLDEYRLEITEGSGDAAITGVLAGFTWSLAGCFTAMVLKTLPARKSMMRVTPVFERKQFEVHLDCIFVTRIVHIILVILILYSNHLRKRKKSRE